MSLLFYGCAPKPFGVPYTIHLASLLAATRSAMSQVTQTLSKQLGLMKIILFCII